jgi:O-antigen/teichoic acid export membrane protein
MPASCVFIAGGDLVVVGLLGPKWLEAAHLIRILAVAGIVLPVSSALSWLLISQGRGRSLMLWSMVGLCTLVAALGVGIQWGLKGAAVGVTADHLLGFVLFTPWACSQGPVRSRDVYRSLLVPVCCSVGGLGAALVIRHAGLALPVLAQAALVTSTALATSAGLCLSIPAGRNSTMEVVRLGRNLVRERFGA